VAIIVYIASALLALLLGNVWLLPRAGLGLRALVTLPLAALLLTPAYIDAEADTLAPALVVAAFQILSGGPEAAMHALQPLVVFSGAALALGLLAFLLALWRGRRDANSDAEPDATG
jgi:hypothetical protein